MYKNYYINCRGRDILNKLLTISIAAYNIEKYINKLMASLLDSRILNRIEVLIINDGSTDKTKEISEEYMKQYPKTVRLINKKNAGHGSTINTGIIEATGKYFRALDGDDWINTEDLVQLIKDMEKINVDLILTNSIYCFEGKKNEVKYRNNLIHGKIYSFEQIAPLVKWMSYHEVIYKTSILKENNIKIDEKCFYVDTEFMIYPIQYINSIIYFNYNIYCYRLGTEGQSVSKKSRIKHIRDSYIVTKSLLNNYKKLPNNMSEKKREYIVKGISRIGIWHISGIMMDKPSKKRLQELKEYEKSIEIVSKKIFIDMENMGRNSRVIKLLRRSKYMLYYPIGWYKQLKNK